MEIEPGIYRPDFPISDNFTTVPNELIRDPDLTPNSKLLLIYFLSHKSGYQILDPQIMQQTGLGREALRSARKHLEAQGLLKLVRIRHEDNSLGPYRYEMQDPRGYFPPVGYPTVAYPTVGYPPNNRKLANKKTTNKKTIVQAKDFVLSDELKARMESEYPALDVNAEVLAFVDYHTAKGSTFKDWNAAFRTWCRNANKWGATSRKTRAQTIADQNKQVLSKYLDEGGK